MRIGIVLHPYDENRPAGLGRAAYEITRNLVEKFPEHTFNIYVKSSSAPRPDFNGSHWHMHRLGEGYFWLERLRNAPSSDIYLFLTPVMPLWWKPPCSVVVIHDLTAFYFSGSGNWRRTFRRPLVRAVQKWSAKKADHVIAISEATKKDAIHFLRISSQKITVIPNGFINVCSNKGDRDISNTPSPYYLFVGVIKARKNVRRLVEGFLKFKKSDTSGTHLIIVGKGGAYRKNICKKIAHSQYSKYVHFLDYVNDAELAALYTHAEAFVFPSLLEGFGMPILEAMACGTLVVTSKDGALAEVAGDAAIFVDPQNVASISDGFSTAFCLTSQERDAYIKKGKERASGFSWEKAAHAYERNFRELVKKNNDRDK